MIDWNNIDMMDWLQQSEPQRWFGGDTVATTQTTGSTQVTTGTQVQAPTQGGSCRHADRLDGRQRRRRVARAQHPV